MTATRVVISYFRVDSRNRRASRARAFPLVRRARARARPRRRRPSATRDRARRPSATRGERRVRRVGVLKCRAKCVEMRKRRAKPRLHTAARVVADGRNARGEHHRARFGRRRRRNRRCHVDAVSPSRGARPTRRRARRAPWTGPTARGRAFRRARARGRRRGRSRWDRDGAAARDAYPRGRRRTRRTRWRCPRARAAMKTRIFAPGT